MIVDAKSLADRTLALWRRRAARLGLKVPDDAYADWTGYNDLRIIYPPARQSVAHYVIRHGQVRYCGRRHAERVAVGKLQQMLRGYVDTYVCRHDESLNLGFFRRYDSDTAINHTRVYGSSPPDHINVCWAYAARKALPTRIDGFRILVRENIHVPDDPSPLPYPTVEVRFTKRIKGRFGGDKEASDYILENPTHWSEGKWQEGDFVFNAYRREHWWRTHDISAIDIASLGVILPSIRYVRAGVVRLDHRDVVALRLAAESV